MNRENDLKERANRVPVPPDADKRDDSNEEAPKVPPTFTEPGTQADDTEEG